MLTDSYGDGMVGQGPNGAGLFKLRTFEEPGNPFTAFDLFLYDGSYEFSQVAESSPWCRPLPPQKTWPSRTPSTCFPTPPTRC